ncbi:MAG: type II toxin-antitoxin system VapC family toxin [Opitutaceae bacterium]|nr:type II toxin-antitoxin system VapC family toxin [Opitutaceae bacterium]
MPLYLLDTNVLSRLARGIDQAISEKVRLNVENCVLSSVVWYELEYGAARSSNPSKSARRLALLRSVFPFVRAFGEEDASEAASVRAYLETLKPNAQPIGTHDVLPAGHARALGAVLVTHNVREFSRIPRLIIEDWQATA